MSLILWKKRGCTQNRSYNADIAHREIDEVHNKRDEGKNIFTLVFYALKSKG